MLMSTDTVLYSLILYCVFNCSFGFYAFVYYVDSKGYDCTGNETSLSSCTYAPAQCILSSVDAGKDNDHVAINCQSVSISS